MAVDELVGRLDLGVDPVQVGARAGRVSLEVVHELRPKIERAVRAVRGLNGGVPVVALGGVPDEAQPCTS